MTKPKVIIYSTNIELLSLLDEIDDLRVWLASDGAEVLRTVCNLDKISLDQFESIRSIRDGLKAVQRHALGVL